MRRFNAQRIAASGPCRTKYWRVASSNAAGRKGPVRCQYNGVAAESDPPGGGRPGHARSRAWRAQCGPWEPEQRLTARSAGDPCRDDWPEQAQSQGGSDVPALLEPRRTAWSALVPRVQDAGCPADQTGSRCSPAHLSSGPPLGAEAEKAGQIGATLARPAFFTGRRLHEGGREGLQRQ